ncbi:hypothetical protein F511_37750 [Dorcoceras hygrometricum]|uniref:Uncharacterized protein n=1 Tax=Dorcoceras hygrometricum TaxID=472368 RepID=A0A2Z7BDG5_9LAMI|nr:hypothetical protein F511_37750 [Dorcoceras hygrometricum]
MTSPERRPPAVAPHEKFERQPRATSRQARCTGALKPSYVARPAAAHIIRPSHYQRPTSMQQRPATIAPIVRPVHEERTTSHGRGARQARQPHGRASPNVARTSALVSRARRDEAAHMRASGRGGRRYMAAVGGQLRSFDFQSEI